MAVSSIVRRGTSDGPAGPPASPRNHIILGVLLAAVLVLLGFLVHSGWGPLNSLDRTIINAADGVRTDSSFRKLLADWSGTFTPGFATATCLALAVVLLFARRIVLAAAVAVAAILGDRLAGWLADTIDTPSLSDNQATPLAASFPSQHTFAAALACGLFLLVLLTTTNHPALRWPIGVVLVGLAVFTAYGRVAAGSDRPSAALGGILLGLLVTVVVAGIGTAARSGWHRLRG